MEYFMRNYGRNKDLTEYVGSNEYRYNGQRYKVSLSRIVDNPGNRPRPILRGINHMLYLEDIGYNRLRARMIQRRDRPVIRDGPRQQYTQRRL